VVFVESRVFTRRLLALGEVISEQVLSAIQADLLDDPERRRLVPGLGGIRKPRTPNPGRGKGKRGGFRFLYMYLETRAHIHLFFLLDKNEREDASPEQRRALREWAAQIKRESGG
jgi:hypothetical protein